MAYYEILDLLRRLKRHMENYNDTEAAILQNAIDYIQNKEEQKYSGRVVLGQEVICPDGLGRVVEFNFSFPGEFIRVDTYVQNRSCEWNPKDVELIDPRKG